MILTTPNTYESVAKKLSEGLRGGKIVLPTNQAVIQEPRLDPVRRMRALVERFDYLVHWRSRVAALTSAAVLLAIALLIITPVGSVAINVLGAIAVTIQLSLAISHWLYASKLESDVAKQIEKLALELTEQQKPSVRPE